MSTFLFRYVIYNESGDCYLGEDLWWVKDLGEARLYVERPELPTNHKGTLSIMWITMEATTVEEVTRG